MLTSTNESVRTVSSGRRTLALSCVAAAILAVFYFATSVYIASQRVFWFDELCTIHVARLPHIQTIWAALGHAFDSQPPFYYMLVRLFGALFGDSEVAARLPSALGLAIGLLLIFDCARRLTDGWHGLIALSVATCSFLPYYGYEARPYGLSFMLASLALWVWLCTPNGKKSSAILFGIVLCLGVTMHYYFVLCLVPYAIWELLFGERGLRLSPKLIAGFVGAVVPAALLSPLILSFSRNFGTGFWNRPSLGALKGISSQMFPDGLSLLVFVVLLVVLAGSDEKTVVLRHMEPAEALGWLFLLIPLAGFVVAELKTNAFYDRYFIGVLPGVAVAFACWVWRNFRNAPMVPVGIFLLFAGWGIAAQMGVVLRPQSVEATGVRDFINLQGPLGNDGKRYAVFSNPLFFIEAQYYSNHPEECVLLLPSDYTPNVHDALSGAIAQEMGWAPYYPLQFWRIADLSNHAAEAALIMPTRDILKDVKAAGFEVETRFSRSLSVAYLRR